MSVSKHEIGITQLQELINNVVETKSNNLCKVKYLQ